MSVRVCAAIWSRFSNGGPYLLAMLALGDYADDNGLKLYPSIKTLAQKMRCSESQARRILHRLIDSGHIEVVGNDRGGIGPRRYRINLEHLSAPVATSRPSTNASGTPSIGMRSSITARASTNARAALAWARADDSHSY